jgi:4-coumarate--CoA ligase
MKVRGFQVAPAELEGHLLMHPAVSDACVVSVPDEYSGEIPLAYVVLNAKSLELINKDRNEGARLKAALIKVLYSCFLV